MINKNPVIQSGIDAGTDACDTMVRVTLANGATLKAGTPILRDVTQAYGGFLPQDLNPSRLFANARVGDTGLLATASGAGDIIGIFQGIGDQGRDYTNNTGASETRAFPCRVWGIGRVFAGAVAAGTAVTNGSKLIVSSSNVFATVGTRAIGTAVGQVVAYPINTTVAAAISTGSQTVTPASMIGITTSTALTVDVGGLQEVVTPSATAATTFTATFANAHAAGVQIVGLNSASGASIIPVPGSGSTSGVILAYINCLA